MVESFQRPLLTISDPTLGFTDTSPGEQYFLILTVSQQNADTPVTIEVDAPDLFQLATDKMPAFTSRVSFTPAPGGTYVHIRHTPHKLGHYEAKLTIQAPYDRQRVTLTGQSARSFPARLWGGLAALFIIGGLVYTGFAYRCEIAPSWCEENKSTNAPAVTEEAPPVATPPIVPADTPSVQLTPSETSPMSISKGVEESDRPRKSTPPVVKETQPVLTETRKEPAPVKTAPVEPSPAPAKVAAVPVRPVSKPVVERKEVNTPAEPTAKPVTKPVVAPLAKTSKAKPVEPQPKRRQAPAPRPSNTIESDLERELNQRFE